MAETSWFYLDRENQTIGPLSFRDIEVLLRTNEIELSTYLWKDDFEDWKHLGQIPEFIQSIAEYDMELVLHMKPSEIPTPLPSEEEKKTQEILKEKHKKQQLKHKKQKLKKREKWYKPKKNTNLYISGLPKTITTDVLKEFFSKAGIIRLDKFTGLPKIKLYLDENGNPKGDALISYMNSESLAMAITLLDKQEIEKGFFIHLEPAEFTQKGDYIARKRVEVNKLELIKARAKKEQLISWDDETKGLQIVIITNFFTPETFDEQLLENLRNFIEDKIGEIARIKPFKFNPDGVVEVKFKKPKDAELCIQELNSREILGKTVKCFYWDGTTDYRRVGLFRSKKAKKKKNSE